MAHAEPGRQPHDTENQAQMFANRLSQRHKQLRKWARSGGITAYRLYDRDIPEVPLAVDLYTLMPPGLSLARALAAFEAEGQAIRQNGAAGADATADMLGRTYLHVYLYERPYDKPQAEEQAWLCRMADAASEALGVPRGHVILKTRRRQSADTSGHRGQYQKGGGSAPVTGMVLEQGQAFWVNLSEYIDTGLFLDHRPLRGMVRDQAQGKRVLNLFCYTGSFSVYAAQGGARLVTSVDASNTYLDWAGRNLRQNGFAGGRYPLVKDDAVRFLRRCTERYDLIVLDPPTFSNSKSRRDALDINRDWPTLIGLCTARLSPGGLLYFSTNSQRLSFRQEQIPACNALDITAKTIPQDFRNQKIHRTWVITNATSSTKDAPTP